MIDYIKILLKNINIERLVNLPDFDFKIEVSEQTAEISTKKIAVYHYATITIYDSGLVFFSGSIHKLWNSLNNTLAPNHKEWKTYKGYNGNQFTINDIQEIRKHLTKLFDCEPQQLEFQNIEFGFNTTPLFNPQLFIKGLLYHNGKPFEFRHKEHFAQVIHQRYYFKIYNKSNQYGISENTLRIELKIIKTEDLKILNIKTFADIKNETLNKAKELVLKRFCEIVYYDNTITKKHLTQRQKNTLSRYSNPRYWLNDLVPKNRDKHKKKLKKFIVDYSEGLQQQLRIEIEQKSTLINRVNGVIINRISETHNSVIINHSSIGLIITPYPPNKQGKKCAITGVDLNLEKKNANYIQTETLKYLRKYNTNKYFEICSILLSKTKGKQPKYERNKITHLAKQIRNKWNRQNENKKTGYNQKVYTNQYEIIFNNSYN